MQATGVVLEFLPPEAGYGPTVALRFLICGQGVWQELVEMPPQFILPNGTGVRMTPASGHPRHSIFPMVAESARSATFVWDAVKDGIDPVRENWIRYYLTFRMAYSNLACNQSPTAPAPPTPPYVPPTPNDPQDPEPPPNTPSTPGSPPVIPIDIENPTVIPQDSDTGIGIDGGTNDTADTGVWDTVVPGMPDPSDVGDTPTVVSPADTVPIDPVAPTSTIPENPPVTNTGGLPTTDSTVDVGGDQPPEVIVVPDDTIVPTEPPGASQGGTSYGSEQVDVFENPGGEPGTEIPFPNEDGPTAYIWPEAINPYTVPTQTISIAGENRYVDGDTGAPMELEVLPYGIIPYGQPATVVMAINNTTPGSFSGVGFIAEYIDEDGNATTIGVGTLDDIEPTGVYGQSFAFESAFFDPGETGTIRAYLVESDLTCRAYYEKDIYLQPENVIISDTPKIAPMTIGDALGDIDFNVRGNLTGNDPVYYLQANDPSGGFMLMIDPFALDSGVTVRLNFGGFDGSGNRTATTNSSEEPLKSPNGLLIDPGSHQVALQGLTMTPGDWYWVEVEQLSGTSGPNQNFEIWAAGFIDPNEQVKPDFNLVAITPSLAVAVHPRGDLTQLGIDGSGYLTGSLYLPYEGDYYVVVNEQTSEAVVVEAVNNTDVQTNAVPASARIAMVPNQTVVVFRLGSDNEMYPIGRYVVDA